jgi:DMSO/TMAO reductase YedYZ molybdopterin-dependent catalytic subunit
VSDMHEPASGEPVLVAEPDVDRLAVLRARLASQLETPQEIPLEEFGQPRALLHLLSRAPLVGPFRPGTWKSPLRGPWVTSMFAIVLLVGLPIVTITGLLSYIAYQPQFHQAIPANVGFLHLPYFLWPSNPTWLYRFTQGLHVALGIALIPVVLAKLWSVIPKLFSWPPAKNLTAVLDRLSLALLVGSILFELATGVLNIQYDYIFKFDFYTAHYYGAWVFIGAFLAHVVVKTPKMIAGAKSRSLRTELRTGLADTHPDPFVPEGHAPQTPAAPTLTRRGLLALVAGSSLLLTVVTLGKTIGNPLRFTAIFDPRGQSYGTGAGHFQVNRTARNAGITDELTGADWRLQITGPHGVTLQLTRTQLLSMPQHTENLPIACVEGWSTQQRWTGVRLRDLATLVGVTTPQTAFVQSLETHGAFRQVTLGSPQLRNHRSLLALQVAGADLLPDHGYPARVIVPALPGVHNTKWVSAIEFRGQP